MPATTHHHLFVITGGPGAGKSTLIAALAARGERCVEESGRAIIQAQMATGGNALPWVDPRAYGEAMLARDLAAFRMAADQPIRTFFDRGFTEHLGYAAHEGFAEPPELTAAAASLRYNRRVFAAPPWRAIYVNDAERRQTWAEAVATYERVTRAYADQGYDLVVLPLTDVEDRARFVLDASPRTERGGRQPKLRSWPHDP